MKELEPLDPGSVEIPLAEGFCVGELWVSMDPNRDNIDMKSVNGKRCKSFLSNKWT